MVVWFFSLSQKSSYVAQAGLKPMSLPTTRIMGNRHYAHPAANGEDTGKWERECSCQEGGTVK